MEETSDLPLPSLENTRRATVSGNGVSYSVTVDLNDDQLARSCPTGHLASPIDATLDPSKDEARSASDEDTDEETGAEVFIKSWE